MENEPSDKEIQEIKDHLEKTRGREFTWEEAKEFRHILTTYTELIVDIALGEMKRQEKLKENPKGYHLDGEIRGCIICMSSATGENSWFDKYGLKCMTCQKAINAKIIPASIAKNKESWYSKIELELYFNLKGAILTKYIKKGLLKDRVIPGDKKKVHLQLFLLKDNKDVLPPKTLLKSRTVTLMRKGEEYQTQERWYEFATIKTLKRLAKYRIVECLEESFSQPIETGQFYVKKVNPLFTAK